MWGPISALGSSGGALVCISPPCVVARLWIWIVVCVGQSRLLMGYVDSGGAQECFEPQAYPTLSYKPQNVHKRHFLRFFLLLSHVF